MKVFQYRIDEDRRKEITMEQAIDFVLLNTKMNRDNAQEVISMSSRLFPLKINQYEFWSE